MGKAADVQPTIFTVEVESIHVFCDKAQPSLDVATGCNLLLGNSEQATANTGASFGFDNPEIINPFIFCPQYCN